MKKVIVLIVIALLMISSSAFAATSEPKTVKELKAEIAIQQKIYTKNSDLASYYLHQLIVGKLDKEKRLDYNNKLKDSRIKRDTAADRMLELRKILWDIEN